MKTKSNELVSVLNEAARRYRRVWWADPVELTQAAWPDVLVAHERYDAAKGDYRGLIYHVAVRAMARHLRRMSSPVSGDVWRKGRLDGLLKESVEDDSLILDECPSRVECISRVRERVTEVLGDDAPYAVRLLTRESTAQEIANEAGVSASLVYKWTMVWRRVLMRDAQLRQLWEEAE